MALTDRARSIIGWVAVGISTLITSMWAFWGVIENFHEGWYSTSVFVNIAVLFVQYLAVMLVFLGATSISILRPRFGAVFHLAAGLGALWFFSGASSKLLLLFIAGPICLLGALYWFGRPLPRMWALRIAVGVPLLVMVVSGIEPAVRVSGRINDGNFGARQIKGSGAELIWAPAGPGWPDRGVDWEEAQRRCAYLSAAGDTILDSVQNIWRLPTVDEAVRSLTRHDSNAGGSWDSISRSASYETMPDKETPLWNPHSQVIYWWTATEVDTANAYIIVYNGQVHPRPKRAYWGYLAFRAVKSITVDSAATPGQSVPESGSSHPAPPPGWAKRFFS